MYGNTGIAWKQIDLSALCVFMFMRCGAPVAVSFFWHFTPKIKKIKSIFHEENHYRSTWKTAYYSEKRLEAWWNKARSQYNRSRRVVMTRFEKPYRVSYKDGLAAAQGLTRPLFSVCGYLQHKKGR